MRYESPHDLAAKIIGWNKKYKAEAEAANHTPEVSTACRADHHAICGGYRCPCNCHLMHRLTIDMGNRCGSFGARASSLAASVTCPACIRLEGMNGADSNRDAHCAGVDLIGDDT